jgi:hypothetical protein
MDDSPEVLSGLSGASVFRRRLMAFDLNVWKAKVAVWD